MFAKKIVQGVQLIEIALVNLGPLGSLWFGRIMCKTERGKQPKTALSNPSQSSFRGG